MTPPETIPLSFLLVRNPINTSYVMSAEDRFITLDTVLSFFDG
jgi:hypothetical protein